MISVKIQSDESVQGQVAQEQIQQQDPSRPSIQTQAVNTALVNAGKQIMTQGINQYADLTGDYATSRAINDFLSIGGDILTIAVAGPVGAIAVGTKYATSIANSFIQQKLAEDNIALSRERVGFISTQKGRYSK